MTRDAELSDAFRDLACWARSTFDENSVEAGLARWEAAGSRETSAAPVLRTPALLPAKLARNPRGTGELIGVPAMERPAMVDHVSRERSRLATQRLRNSSGEDSRCGRLLGLTVDQSDSSGASMQNSRGLFTLWDTPPWDLWFTYVVPDGLPHSESYLVSWIPNWLLQYAEVAVRVNPLNCLWWLDSRDDPFIRALTRLAR
jgi:hypothetical protein